MFCSPCGVNVQHKKRVILLLQTADALVNNKERQQNYKLQFKIYHH